MKTSKFFPALVIFFTGRAIFPARLPVKIPQYLRLPVNACNSRAQVRRGQSDGGGHSEGGPTMMGGRSEGGPSPVDSLLDNIR